MGSLTKWYPPRPHRVNFPDQATPFPQHIPRRVRGHYRFQLPLPWLPVLSIRICTITRCHYLSQRDAKAHYECRPLLCLLLCPRTQLRHGHHRTAYLHLSSSQIAIHLTDLFEAWTLFLFLPLQVLCRIRGACLLTRCTTNRLGKRFRSAGLACCLTSTMTPGLSSTNLNSHHNLIKFNHNISRNLSKIVCLKFRVLDLSTTSLGIDQFSYWGIYFILSCYQYSLFDLYLFSFLFISIASELQIHGPIAPVHD